jgi:uncharacterized membrane-anchored protein YhcB (DUF1043 family)
MLKIYGLVAVVMFMTMLGGGAYKYYTSTQNTIIQLTENNVQLKENQIQLEEAVQTANETVDYLRNNFETIKKNFEEASAQLQISREQNNQLTERLGRHEIGVLAIAKPKLVERIINNASSEAMRCFELLSGAPLTEEEKNAENERQFNSECPWLYVDLVKP